MVIPISNPRGVPSLQTTIIRRDVLYDITGKWGPQNLSGFKNSPAAKGICHLWPDFQERKCGSLFQWLGSLQTGHYLISPPASGEMGSDIVQDVKTTCHLDRFFPGSLASLSHLPSESLYCLRTFPRVGKEKEERRKRLYSNEIILFLWIPLTGEGKNKNKERMEMGLVRSCVPFRSPCKRKGWLTIWGKLGWACPSWVPDVTW